MSDRRKEERDEQPDRREWPRPPLALNLILLALGVLLSILAYGHDRSMEKQFQKVMIRGAETPKELRRIRDEVSRMDLTGDALKQELATRTAAIKSKSALEFYVSIDTQKKVFGLYYGPDLVREAPVVIGPPRTVNTPEKQWSFPPFKGSVRVERKYEGLNWKVPDWVWVMNGQPIPPDAQRVAGGIGQYVIELPNDYIIHSEPAADSPLKGAKPGSFLVPAETLRAVWPRIREGTRVYIF